MYFFWYSVENTLSDNSEIIILNYVIVYCQKYIDHYKEIDTHSVT